VRAEAFGDPNALMTQEGLDRIAPLRIAVAKQNSSRSDHAIHRVGQLTHSLKHERFVWMPCRTTYAHSPRVQFDHKHRVVRRQPTTRPHFHCKEVSGDERRPMRA
jgi:hypothetical protein